MLLLEVLPRAGVVDQDFVPPFSVMLDALVELGRSADLWTALGDTMRGWAIGFTAAMAGGVTLGIIVGSVPLLREATASTIEFLRPIPSVALIPLAVLLFGTDMRATLVLVIYASFWQVLVQVLYGVQDVDPVAQQTARCYGLRPLTVVRTVIWPTALPYVMTGFRLAANVALVLEIVGELVIGTPGLGSQIALAQTGGQVPSLYALVLVAGLLGVAMNTLARAIQARVLRWHPSIRGERS
jgi:ABC-type nitrate/sulfonate/bicarbonate transport system permease component